MAKSSCFRSENTKLDYVDFRSSNLVDCDINILSSIMTSFEIFLVKISLFYNNMYNCFPFLLFWDVKIFLSKDL